MLDLILFCVIAYFVIKGALILGALFACWWD